MIALLRMSKAELLGKIRELHGKLRGTRSSLVKRKIPDYQKSYNKQTQGLLQKHNEEKAMALAVGGAYEEFGLLEYYLLLQNGLRREQTVIDVGCGSGRLAFQLKEYLTGLYVGIDVVRELYSYAQKVCNRPDWKFYTAPGLTIPEADNFADFICFFSVFTHLLHEETFKYLKDARRVIKPGGKIIFSYLEFAVPSHWAVFENSLADTSSDTVLNQFLSRDAIVAWADHLELSVLEINSGDKPNIILNKTARWEEDREMKEKGIFGQSVCILTKK